MTFVDFPYQTTGAAFLAGRRTAYLADEMGLGKSRQAIRAADTVAPADDVLVVGPAIARENWVAQFELHSPWTRAFTIVESERDTIPERGSVAVSYTLASSVAFRKLVLKRPPFSAIVLDEAHMLKRVEAGRTKSILATDGLVRRAHQVWAMSGTPYPNGDPREIYWIARVLYADAIRDPRDSTRLFSFDEFERFYTVTARTRFRRDKLVRLQNTDALRERLAPWMLRRKLKDVEVELPPLRFGEIVITADPIPAEYEGAVIPVAAEDLPDPDTEPFATARRLLAEAKAHPVADFLTADLENGLDKVVVFGWHRDALHKLAQRMGVPDRVLQGGQSPKRQKRLIDKFNNDPGERAIAVQIATAGTVIDLTAATNVVFLEHAARSGDNAQAVKRVHRIGQSRPCLARSAIAKGTIDVPFQRRLQQKTQFVLQLEG